MAPSPAVTFDSLRRRLANGQYDPVYLLHGEEGFYIDELVKEFEKIIPADDKEFAQYTLYAPQVEPGAVMDLCMSVPMMSDRQVVILKEAQAVDANWINRLQRYVLNPSPTTILVICVRGAQAKGKDFLAAIKQTGAVCFESRKLWDYQLPAVIAGLVADKGMRAGDKAVKMLADFIGTDLSRLHNEIAKLADILGRGAEITPEAIERNIGYSKDFNTFELVDAVAARDEAKCWRIAAYFAANPKAVSMVLVCSALFGLFSDLVIAIWTPDRSDDGLKKALGLKNAFALRRLRLALSHYNAYQIIEIIDALRRFDAMIKGNGSRQAAPDLFRDLLFHIFTAPGKLPV